MKTHAPSGKKRSARFATATIALFAALAPASAWALEIPVPNAEQACPATGIETVAPFQVAVQTKSEAILGGTRSKLEELKAQQAAAAAAIAPAPAPIVQLAMLSPAAGPATIAAVKAHDPVELLDEYAKKKEEFYHAIVERRPENARFIKGWLNRVAHVGEIAKTMVA